ncbi:hypothetical protein AHAS_Ahas11G0229200 [Arachis hypogaea]
MKGVGNDGLNNDDDGSYEVFCEEFEKKKKTLEGVVNICRQHHGSTLSTRGGRVASGIQPVFAEILARFSEIAGAHSTQVVSGYTDSNDKFLQSQSIAIFVRDPVIFCLLGSTLFVDKSMPYAHVKYLPLLRDFERFHTYSWGSACLAYLYMALYYASRYNTKEMDDPLNLLFVWVWERMPCIVPVPRQYLPAIDVSVARR